MAANLGPKKKTISEINVTPFVDVMLVLLVIFMITAPMLEQGIDLNLPDVSAPSLPQKEKKLTVRILTTGEVRVDNAALPADRINQALGAIVKTRKDEPIYVEADDQVNYGKVAGILGTIRQSGGTKIHLVTEEPPQP